LREPDLSLAQIEGRQRFVRKRAIRCFYAGMEKIELSQFQWLA
jgi:hypothetical protein